jgi:hypothetical protein
MKKVVLIIIGTLMVILSGVYLGKFYQTQLRANSDYYFLILSIIFSIVGISSWWLTFKKT